MPITRTFTVAELEDIGFPFDLPEGVEVEDTLIDKRRWYENRRLVFRHDGQVWAAPYASEYQDDSGVDWHHNARGGIVTATAMEQREVTVIQWLPIEESADRCVCTCPTCEASGPGCCRDGGPDA